MALHRRASPEATCDIRNQILTGYRIAMRRMSGIVFVLMLACTGGGGAQAQPQPLAIAGEIVPSLTQVARAGLAGFEHTRITHITFHHEGFAGEDADLFGRASAARDKQSIAQRVRNIDHYHATQAGLGMFAYHYAVDKAGNIAKGRPVRLKPATRSTLPGSRKLADFDGHFAVVALGDFNHERLTPAARLAYVRVMSEAQRAYRVPTAQIQPHRHHASTSCPGRHIMAEAEDLPRMVRAYSLQTELALRGCLAEAPDGRWGPKSSNALGRLVAQHPDALGQGSDTDAMLFRLLDQPQVRCGIGG
jgi:hypothetical protein